MASQDGDWDPVFGGMAPHALPWTDRTTGQDQALELYAPVLTPENIAIITRLEDVEKRIENVRTKAGLRYFELDDQNQTVRRKISSEYEHCSGSMVVAMLPIAALNRIRHLVERYGFELVMNEYDTIIFKRGPRNVGRSSTLTGLWQLRRRSTVLNILSDMDKNVLVAAIRKYKLEVAQQVSAQATTCQTQSGQSTAQSSPRDSIMSSATQQTDITEPDKLPTALPRPRPRRHVQFADEVGQNLVTARSVTGLSLLPLHRQAL